FEQDAVRELDWTRLGEALTQADPNKIDVRSLEHREQNAPYFLKQVRERLAPSSTAAAAGAEPVRVLIVLAAPMTLDSGEKIRVPESEAKQQGPLYFVRYHLPPERPPLWYEPMSRMGRRGNGNMQQPAGPAEAFDSLQPLLK